MNQVELPVFDIESYKDEIESLRRVNKQFIVLRSWALTICLASLAFTITTFVQIRLGGVMPFARLGAIALASLSISTLGAFYLRFCHEFSNLASDMMQLGPFSKKLIELAESSNPSPEELEKLKKLLEPINEKLKKVEINKEIDPYEELRRFIFTAVTFVVGLVTFLLYLFIYLFVG